MAKLRARRAAEGHLACANRPSCERLQEFKPVPVRILAIEPAHAGELGIEAHRVPGVAQPAGPGVQPGYEQARMGFAGRPEVLLDAEVNFDVMAPEPTTAACSQARRLLDFLQSKYATVEVAECWLASLGAGQLNMVDQGTRPIYLDIEIIAAPDGTAWRRRRLARDNQLALDAGVLGPGRRGLLPRGVVLASPLATIRTPAQIRAAPVS